MDKNRKEINIVGLSSAIILLILMILTICTTINAELTKNQLQEKWKFKANIFFSPSALLDESFPAFDRGALATPIISNGKIFIRAEHVFGTKFYLYCINLTDGTLVWKKKFRGFTMNLTIGKEVIYVGTCPSTTGDSVEAIIYAVDAQSSKILWQHNLPLIRDISTPTLRLKYSQGKIYLGIEDVRDENLYAFNASTGNILWKKKIKGQIGNTPIITKDLIYITSVKWEKKPFTSLVTALNRKRGKINWDYEINGTIPRSNLILSRDTLFFAGDEKGHGFIYALEADTRKLKWKFLTEMSTAWAPHSFWTPELKENILYVLDEENIYAINSESGDLKWKLRGTELAKLAQEKYWSGWGYPGFLFSASKKYVYLPVGNRIIVVDRFSGITKDVYNMKRHAPIAISKEDDLLLVTTYDGRLYCFEEDVKQHE